MLVLLAGTYFVIGRLSLMLATLHPSASPVWPPTGFALAMLLLLGVRYWPAVLVGAFFVNAATDVALPTAGVIAIGNTLEALVGFFLIDVFAGRERTFESVRGVLRFTLFAALASPIVSASFGVVALMLEGSVQRAAAQNVWFTWWLGDVVGSLTITPLIVLWFKSRNVRAGGTLWEAIGLFAFHILVCAVVFTPLQVPLGYLTLLPILWTALRFSPKATMLSVALISALSIAGTLKGWGPYAMADANSSLLFLQAFLAVGSFIGLVLSVALLERRLAERSLETSVLERTQELVDARAQDRASLERLRNVIDHMSVATIAVDEHLKLLHMNDAFRNLFRLDEKTNNVRSLSEIFSQIRGEFYEPHEAIDGMLQALSERRKTLDRELRLKDGVGIFCDYIPVFDVGTHRGHVFVFRDQQLL